MKQTPINRVPWMPAWDATLTRRSLLGLAGLAGGIVALGPARALATGAPRSAGRRLLQDGGMVDELVIDIGVEPPSLDPAIVYDASSWSVVHSIHDALVQYGPGGELEPLLAESLTWLDPLTYEIKLRSGLTFHNGEPVDATAVAFTVAHILDPNTASQVKQNFAVISEVKAIDPLTAHLLLTSPAPWLPAQMAAWLALLPPGYAAANAVGSAPVGTGPYRFVEWAPGAQITLEVNPDYFPASPKGRPIARRVVYRFVPEASTRVADLLAGTSHLIQNVPVDQVQPVRDAGAEVIVSPVAGSSWIRIATDVAPFDDPRVRLALNHAVDVETIIDALLGGEGERLPNFFVEGGLGYDPALAPHAYDPDLAKRLLAEAGYPDGFETALEYTLSERDDLVAAIAAQLEAVGVKVELRAVETATFNQTWTDPEAAPLRFVTWRPIFDPFTLLSLLVSNQGFLSRHDNPNAQPLIDAGAVETDPAKRADIYRRLGRVLYEEPAAIYLYSLTARYGVAADLPAWTPRPDEYIIATAR